MVSIHHLQRTFRHALDHTTGTWGKAYRCDVSLSILAGDASDLIALLKEGT
jgi:hypothetical protein